MTAVSRFAAAGAWPALRFGEAKREIFNASLRALTCTLVAVVVFSLLIVPVTLWLGGGQRLGDCGVVYLAACRWECLTVW